MGRRDHTRGAIVGAASRLFEAHGVRATTIEQVAQEAYVSVGAIYTHFANKEGLVWFFVDAGLEALEASMCETRVSASPLERIEGAGSAYLRFAAEHPIAARFAAVRVLDPDPSPEFVAVNDACTERMRPIVTDIATDVRAAMDQGQITPASVGDTMTYLWSLWKGAASFMLRQDEFATSRASAERAIARGYLALQPANARHPAEPAPSSPE